MNTIVLPTSVRIIIIFLNDDFILVPYLDEHYCRLK